MPNYQYPYEIIVTSLIIIKVNLFNCWVFKYTKFGYWTKVLPFNVLSTTFWTTKICRWNLNCKKAWVWSMSYDSIQGNFGTGVKRLNTKQTRTHTLLVKHILTFYCLIFQTPPFELYSHYLLALEETSRTFLSPILGKVYKFNICLIQMLSNF